MGGIFNEKEVKVKYTFSNDKNKCTVGCPGFAASFGISRYFKDPINKRICMYGSNDLTNCVCSYLDTNYRPLHDASKYKAIYIEGRI